jgi:hypothetical protein
MSSRSNRGFHSQECECRKLTRQVPLNMRKRGNSAENNARITREQGEVNGGLNRICARMRLKKRSLSCQKQENRRAFGIKCAL